MNQTTVYSTPAGDVHLKVGYEWEIDAPSNELKHVMVLDVTDSNGEPCTGEMAGWAALLVEEQKNLFHQSMESIFRARKPLNEVRRRVNPSHQPSIDGDWQEY